MAGLRLLLIGSIVGLLAGFPQLHSLVRESREMATRAARIAQRVLVREELPRVADAIGRRLHPCEDRSGAMYVGPR